MEFRTCLQVIFLLQSIKISFGSYYKTKYREEIVKGTDFIPDTGFLVCSCHGKSVRINIPKKDRLTVYGKFPYFGHCNLNGKKEICLLYRSCHTCSFHMVECQPSVTDHNKYDCQKKSFETYQKTTFHVINEATEVPISVESKDFSTKLRLHKRELPYCSLPNNSETYDLICRKYQSHIKCVQICIHGYTLKTGVSKRRRCLFKEDKWKPIGFNECRPYVDCGMTLIHPGILECNPASTADFPSCNVTCDPFEGKYGTPLETFECGITGRWNKELPFCVIPKAGLVGNLLTGSELVPPPKNYRYPSEEDLLKFPEED